MSDQEQDKSEAATPYKLERAKEKGAVPKSTDAVTIVSLAAFVIYLYSMGWVTIQKQLRFDASIFQRSTNLDWTPQGVLSWLGDALLGGVLLLMLPLFMVLMIAAIVGNVAQTGAVLSAQALSPDFDRINPSNGWKRLFSMRGLYEAGKSTFKLAIVSFVMFLIFSAELEGILLLGNVDPHGYAKFTLDQLTSLLTKLLLALSVLAIIDVVYSRWEFAKRMRMSRRELRDEHKQREGDPRIRTRLRELRNEFLQRTKTLKRVPSADVLLTNPTHVAVALAYRHGVMPAPQVVAKGSGDLAARMRDIARKHAIPIVQNPTLAREIFHHVPDEKYIPEHLYPQVAKILLWVFSMHDARKSGGKNA